MNNKQILLKMEEEGLIKDLTIYKQAFPVHSIVYGVIGEKYHWLYCTDKHPIDNYKDRVMIFPESGTYTTIDAIHPENFLNKIKSTPLRRIVLFNLDMFYIPKVNKWAIKKYYRYWKKVLFTIVH